MTGKFHNNKSVLWLLGVGVLIVGFIAFAIIVPNATTSPGSEGPEINVPRMQNIPPDEAPNMKLDIE